MVPTETVSIQPRSSTGFVRVAIMGFRTNGIIVHGVMVRDLRRVLPVKQPRSDIIRNVNIAMEKLCVSCAIVPGAVAKSRSPGNRDLFLKYAAVVDGL